MRRLAGDPEGTTPMEDRSLSAVVLSRGQTFMILDPSGEIATGEQGLYAGDRRLCSRYAWRIAGRRSLLLSGRVLGPASAQFFLVPPAYAHDGRAEVVLERRVDLMEAAFRDVLHLRNYGARNRTLHLELDFACDFAHVFHVKRNALGNGGAPAREAARPMPQGDLMYLCRGTPDQGGLAVGVTLSQPADQPNGDGGAIAFRVALPAYGEADLAITAGLTPRSAPPEPRPLPEASAAPLLDASGPLGPTLVQAFRRSMQDLEALSIRGGAIGRASSDPDVAYAAGIPWYIALFGRDALLTSRMSVFCLPRQGEGSLRALARLQGTRWDPETDEASGKILHEYRPQPGPDVPTLIPRFPYYGSVDATALFIIALEEQVRTADSLDLLHELRSNLLRALEWVEASVDRRGYLRYQRQGDDGLVNQGWKDSWDAVHFRDGRLAQGPIALVEVQGYLYRARVVAARLLRALGDEDAATRQEGLAAALRRNFDRDFWLDRGYYALGLDGSGLPIDVLTSNSLHVLWTGIAQRGRAARLARDLLSSPLWSGRGVRTLAMGEGRYNPVSYHNGSIWPHDNVLIAEGLRRTGHPRQAMAIVEAMLRVARSRSERRLPELFAGFGKDESSEPVRYPSACPVQAWAAASVPHMVTLMLGLVAAASEVRLRPSLPPGVDRITVEGLRVAKGRLDVHVERDRRQRIHCEVGGNVALPVRVLRGVRPAGEGDEG